MVCEKPNNVVSGKVREVLFVANESYAGPDLIKLCLKGNNKSK